MIGLFSPLLLISRVFLQQPKVDLTKFVFSTQQNLRIFKISRYDCPLPSLCGQFSGQSFLLPASSAEELWREDSTDLSLSDFHVKTSVYAETDCCCILSYLHEARGLVIRWILMYQLTSWQTPLPHSGCLGLTFWEIKTPKRPRWTLITRSERM